MSRGDDRVPGSCSHTTPSLHDRGRHAELWKLVFPPPPVITKWKCLGATAVQPHEVREAHGALKPPTLCWLSTCQASNLLQHQHQNKNSVPGAWWHGFHGPASPVGVRCRWPCALSLFTSSSENREKEKHQLHNSTKTQQHPEHQYLHPDGITGIGRGDVVIRHWGLRVVELGERCLCCIHWLCPDLPCLIKPADLGVISDTVGD